MHKIRKKIMHVKNTRLHACNLLVSEESRLSFPNKEHHLCLAVCMPQKGIRRMVQECVF